MTVKYENGIINFKQDTSGATWTNDLNTDKYEMLYINEFDPTQDIYPGIGAGIASKIDAKLLYSISKFPEMYFEGGAMPVTLLGIDATDKNEIERVQNWFKKSATAIKNAFRVMGMRAGSITATTLTPPLKDLAFPELDKMSKDNIAMAFGIKQTLLDSEAANYATAQEDRLSFYEDTIKPRARIFADALNTQLLEQDGMRLEFRFEEMDIFQEDEGVRADLLNKLTLAGMPIELALELAGYKLTDEQEAMLNAHQEQLDEREDVAVSEQVDEREAELRRWQRMAEKRIKDGKGIREFESSIIEPSLHGAISGALEAAKSVEDVKHLFDSVIAWKDYP
jgi:hypothetical protein